MKSAAAFPPSFFLLVLGLIPSLTAHIDAQRRGGAYARRSMNARWAQDGKHVVYKGTWYDPITWKTTEAGEEVGQVGQKRQGGGPGGTAPATGLGDTQSLFLAAVNRARGKAKGKARGDTVSSTQLRPVIARSTLPRHAVENPGARFSQDRKIVAASFGGELWAWRTGGKAKKLSGAVKGMRHFAIAPTGAAASYILGNNLYIARTDDGDIFQLTQDGDENTFNGELDWVYQEEVYGRGDFRASWWSGDGEHLAFMRIDESGVDTFRIVDHIPNQLGVEMLKYPKAGRTNPRATLRIADAKGGKVVDVDLSRYKPADEILIVRVGWTPNADECIYMVQNREQTWLDLNFADPTTGKSTRIIHEESGDSWVERVPMPRWLKNGTFIWESDRTGYRHFYRYDATGKLRNVISKGPWSAGSILKVDEDRGWMGFTGTTANYSIGSNAYYAKLDGSELHRVTKGRGNHRVSFNGDGSMVLDAFSNLENPGEQWLRKIDGTDVREVYARKAPTGANYTQWKQIKARDGEMLDVTYTLPGNFDPKKKYPVWVSTYSGPASPSVRDRWRGPARGTRFIVLSVNVRSASTRGLKYTKQCYKQFGVQELQDIEDTIDWMCKNDWADASRVGITGWSYGGFMTAFALTHSKKFKCGIAGAGVYDWALYDTIYTERYMKKPQNNRSGYRASSCVAAARNLTGELLIIHGTMDDNVHMQNSIQFLDALQKAGKTNFTFMLYPKSRHGVRSPHLNLLRQKFMREHL